MIRSTKILFLFLLALNSRTVCGQEIPVPVNYSIVDTVSGDLDNDGKPELVVAYNTKKEDESSKSVTRDLIIYKLTNEKWAVWQTSGQALYESRGGGMMGDPFGGIEIHNGILQISQNGGSSWKWNHTDKYRFQDGTFFLIGYAANFGKICEEWTNVDFNLSTGELIVKKEYEDCETAEASIFKTESETVYEKGIKITLQNRSEREIKVVTPRYKHEIYIAIEKE